MNYNFDEIINRQEKVAENVGFPSIIPAIFSY